MRDTASLKKYGIIEWRINMATKNVIDLENWPRKVHCSIFRDSLQPQYCISFDLNVTKFLSKVKVNHLPFSLTLIYLVTKCANSIENFRYRFEDGNVVLYDKIDTSFTYLSEGEELFKQINVEMQDTLEDFIQLAQDTIKHQKAYFTSPPGNNVFVFSAIPWVSFHYLSHTYSGNKDSASPMFDWGKYAEHNGVVSMPFTVQVHHSFIDGIHIGQFVQRLQEELDSF